jgi:hypothetical protein
MPFRSTIIKLYSKSPLTVRSLAKLYSQINQTFFEETLLEEFQDYITILEVDSTLSVEEIWDRWFSVSSSDGGEYLNFLKLKQDFLDIKVSKWCQPSELADHPKPLKDIRDLNLWSPPLSTVKPRSHRNLAYRTPIKISLPFIPSHVDCISKETLLSVNPTNLIIKVVTETPTFGVVTNLLHTFKKLNRNSSITTIKIMCKLELNGPVALRAMAKQRAMESLDNFYRLWISNLVPSNSPIIRSIVTEEATEDNSDIAPNNKRELELTYLFTVSVALVLGILVCNVITLNMIFIIISKR